MLFTCGLFPCSSGESCDFFKNDRIHLPSRRCPIPNLWHFYLRPRQYCNLPAVCFEISFEPSVMKLDDLSCQIETSWWWTIPSFIILVCQMCLSVSLKSFPLRYISIPYLPSYQSPLLLPSFATDIVIIGGTDSAAFRRNARGPVKNYLADFFR